MAGGECGARGVNLLFIKDSGRCISLGGKNTVAVKPCDRIMILSPGGGGYGQSSVSDEEKGGVAFVKNTVLLKSSGSVNQYTLDQESA
jgi:5-oxoprolinase (ATP-hydrolysing)